MIVAAKGIKNFKNETCKFGLYSENETSFSIWIYKLIVSKHFKIKNYNVIDSSEIDNSFPHIRHYKVVSELNKTHVNKSSQVNIDLLKIYTVKKETPTTFPDELLFSTFESDEISQMVENYAMKDKIGRVRKNGKML